MKLRAIPGTHVRAVVKRTFQVNRGGESMLRAKHIAVLLVILLLTAPSFAQDKEKIKFLIPTEKGSTGLFHLYTADTLRQGELSFSVSGSRYHRQPGDLKFYLYPVP
jgi:hypothetical protein